MTEYKAELQQLLKHLSDQLPELDAETRGIQMFGAPGLNVFSMFEPDERRVTRILADFLDPKGRHGQGELFLNAFLAAARLRPVKRQAQVSVVVDDRTFMGRLVDITVSTPETILGIEVKLWAPQAKKQLMDYASYLEKKAQDQQKEWKLVLLADQEPETAKDKAIRMPWVKVVKNESKGEISDPLSVILDSTLQNIHAMRTHVFLKDFLAWINDKFWGSPMNNNEYKSYVEAVYEHLDDKPRAVAALMLAQKELLNRVLNSIGEALLEGLKQVANDFLSEEKRDAACLATGREWLLYRPHWPRNLQVGLRHRALCVKAKAA